jgi:hypothetical protein
MDLYQIKVLNNSVSTEFIRVNIVTLVNSRTSDNGLLSPLLLLLLLLLLFNKYLENVSIRSA